MQNAVKISDTNFQVTSVLTVACLKCDKKFHPKGLWLHCKDNLK
jgi:hypothetical protein